MTDFLNARWENLVMVNYAVDQDILLPYLPNGVELDYYKDKTYVSLVGFLFRKTKIFKIPIPYLGTFEEINLRFYVKRIYNNEVKRGVVFINETPAHGSAISMPPVWPKSLTACWLRHRR